MPVKLYGTWRSRLESDSVGSLMSQLSEVKLENGTLYWLEQRATEQGRGVVVSSLNGDLLDGRFSALNSVHEYGGGSFTIKSGVVFFTNQQDGGIYSVTKDRSARPICVETTAPQFRFADLNVAGGWVLAVRETSIATRNSSNELVAVPMNSPTMVSVLASGSDFYAAPRIAPNGKTLVWLEWDHPNMPWDGTRLMGADFSAGAVANVHQIAGGEQQSVALPQWSPAGVLHFVSDSNGWWNLWTAGDEGCKVLAQLEAECAEPAWVFGMSSYGFLDDGELVCSVRNGAFQKLVKITPDGAVSEVTDDYSSINYVACEGRSVAFVGATASTPATVVKIDLATDTRTVCGRQPDIPDIACSVPTAITFASGDGTAHLLFYPAYNPDFESPPGSLPPLIINCHGGPTGIASGKFDLRVQFWTSRGFAYADLNYRGSSGYGRAYREALNGNWGIVDVDDCVAAAHYLAQNGMVDSERMVVRGASAGGYTALCALAQTGGVFKAGASYYGVSDLGSLSTETHKFESHYLEKLIGARIEDDPGLYKERSPIGKLDDFRTPLIVFQGTDDQVVPVSQAETIVNALKDRGVVCAYLPFSGERHGFKTPANVARALRAELFFYGRILGLDVDGAEPIEISGLAIEP